MSDNIASNSCVDGVVQWDESCSDDLLQALSHLIQKPANQWGLEDIQTVTFHSVEEAEQFYNSYAFILGFSIRRDRFSMRRNIISMRNWLCSKAGFRRTTNNGVEGSSKKSTRLVTRCGCLAGFKVKYSFDDNLYHPVEFSVIHNHELVESKLSHFLPSHRRVDEYSAHQISELRAVGVKPSKIMNVLVNSAGGYEWVGFTRKDLYNHVYMSSKQRQQHNDTHMAMQYIQAIASKDPGVWCRYVADGHGRLTRIFYSDTISRSEYRAFGDVIIVDSTYKTNEYRLPFVFIVGVDNHHATIVFGCALLSDETHDTYQWVFNTFIECMEGKHPTSIITDGDRAMRSAIAQVMPMTRHRLCGWHLLRNSSGVCADPNFKTRLNRLITKRYSVPVFSHKWNMLLKEYGMNKGDRKWVTEMQQSSHLWAETFFADCFFAGTVTNGRAESTNRTLKTFVDEHLPLSQLFHKYLIFLDSLRQRAMGMECKNSQAMPPIIDSRFESLRKQLAELYTIQIYKKVDAQIGREHLFRAERVTLSLDASEQRFYVQRYDSKNAHANFYDVSWFRVTDLLKCSCGMMESEGFPCAHIFAVMKQSNICHLGQDNLKPRWMKDARSMCVMSSSCAQHISGPAHRLTTIRPYCDTLAYLSSFSDDHLHIAQHEIELLCQRLSAMGDQNTMIGQLEENIFAPHMPDGAILKDPHVVRTKGAPRTTRGLKSRRNCSKCKMPGHNKSTCKALTTHEKSEIEGEDEESACVQDWCFEGDCDMGSHSQTMDIP